MRNPRFADEDSTAIRVRTAAESASAALPAGLHPVLRRVLAARQVGATQLQPQLAQLIPVGKLPGVQAAADRLVIARQRGERVLVIGDFDVDGATATALSMRCLHAFGFRTPDFLVPDRFRYGYGLSPAIAELAASREPALLVTVDNGITSLEGVRRARELGMEVLITDHHLAGPVLPDEALIVNPNLPGSEFGSPALCGVGVAFYLMAATGRRLAELGIISAEVAREAVTDCLDLVALGTVADLVPLDFNNRILVAEGLRRMRAGRTRPGIEALFRVAGRELQLARSADMGFAIAPRLNAAGRLEDMTIGINCLLASDAATAQALATRLDGLNLERRALQQQMQAEAEALLDGLGAGAGTAEPAICLFDERWHPGIVGLVANRLREITGCPAIAFARCPETGMLRGSARSVDGLHVRDAMAEALAAMSGPVVRFGGHAMAAGITLPEDRLEQFRSAFALAVGRQRDLVGSDDSLWTDGTLEAHDLQLDLAETLAAAGPWGQGFPEPLFDNVFRLCEQRVIGERHLRIRVQHPDGGEPVDAVAFNQLPLQTARNAPVRLIYRLDINTWRQTRTAQLVVEHIA
jgi:single-stranded-DNA-specific exonuclease